MAKPTHQSIFGDTYHGVINPNVPHVHPYPTRYHGPNYNVPRFYGPYQPQSWQVAPVYKNGYVVGSHLRGNRFFYGVVKPAMPQFAGDDSSLKINMDLGMAAIGGAIGALGAPHKDDRMVWAIAGAGASALGGVVGVVGITAAAFLFGRGTELLSKRGRS